MKVIFLALALMAFGGSAAQAGPSLQPLAGASDWLGRKPALAQLHGKVVIVDVFTFACINCKHVVPELRSLYRSKSRRDLAIVGIHSPETAYERDRANVVKNLALQGITWPVALDNSFALWRAFDIEYWPTQLIFDRGGVLRETIIGEGQDARVAAVVSRLIGQQISLRGGITRTSRLAADVPNGRRYSVRISGAPGAAVRLRAIGLPPTWVGSFCTPRICAPFRVSLTLPSSGTLEVGYLVIPAERQASRPLRVQIEMTTGMEVRRISLNG